MKPFGVLSVLFLGSLAVAAPLGQEQPRPFPGAGAVRLHTREAPAAALSGLAAVARKQGYAVDTLSGTRLATAPRAYEFRTRGAVTRAVYRFAAAAEPEGAGAVLTLSGTFRITQEGKQDEAEPMAYGGARTSQSAACFGQAQRLAFGYPRGKVGYQARP